MPWESPGGMGMPPDSIPGNTFVLCASANSVSPRTSTNKRGPDVSRRSKASPAANARKAGKVAFVLEEFLGIPRKPRRAEPPLESLIATLLSQNTNDRNSHKAWVTLRKQFPTWQKVARAPHARLVKAIEVGGLKNQKARRIKDILETVKEQTGKYDLNGLKRMSDEEVIEYLTSMKGVGLKTAACVLVFSLGRDAFPVDTHIHRICNRLGFVRTKNAEETYHAMQPLVPKGKAYCFHVNLIRFGRSVCRAQNPFCNACPLFDECTFPLKERFASQSRTARVGEKADADFIILHNLAVA